MTHCVICYDMELVATKPACNISGDLTCEKCENITHIQDVEAIHMGRAKGSGGYYHEFRLKHPFQCPHCSHVKFSLYPYCSDDDSGLASELFELAVYKDAEVR